MLSFREFLSSDDKPPPDLVATANKAKQVLGQARGAINGPNKDSAQSQKQIMQLKNVSDDLTKKSHDFQLQQVNKTADKIIQNAQPAGPRF